MSTLIVKRKKSWAGSDAWGVYVDGLRVDALYREGSTVTVTRPGSFVCFVKCTTDLYDTSYSSEYRIPVSDGQTKKVALKYKSKFPSGFTFEEVNEEEEQRLAAEYEAKAKADKESGLGAAKSSVTWAVFGAAFSFLTWSGFPVGLPFAILAIVQGIRARKIGWEGASAIVGIALGFIGLVLCLVKVSM